MTNTGTDSDSERGIGVSTCGAAAPYALAFFPAASSSHWQGFARIINHSPVSGTVSIDAELGHGVGLGAASDVTAKSIESEAASASSPNPISHQPRGDVIAGARDEGVL